MPCTYSYPNDNTVKTTFWFVGETVDLAETPEYKGRVEYRGNKEHDCTLRVRDLRESDSKTYFFRFITDTDSYSGKGGSTLSVTDLQVEVNPATVREGQSVTLTCRTTCTLSGSPAFIWYKNKLPLSTTNLYNKYIQFTASSEDSGSYSCGVRGHENLSSPAVTLSVRYPPKNTSVSVSPSGEIVEGTSVTLTCSSNANPPVQRYTWFKKSTAITSRRGSEQSYTIKDIKPSDSGEYYCEAVNGVGSGSSPHILLNVQYLQVEVNPATVTEGQRVTLTCRTTCTLSGRPAFIWYKNKLPLTPSTPPNNYLQFTASSEDSGSYSCGVRENLSSPAVTLSVRYPPKNTSVSVSSSGKIVEGGSVTLTCSSNANPPVQRYTWFKKNDTGVWQTGSGQRLNTYNFMSWNSGQYYCEAENKHGVHNSPALLLLSITTKGEKGLLVTICASAGITALVTLVLVAVTVWMCKRKKGGIPSARERGADTQACSNPVNDTYTTLNLNDVSSGYDTLTSARPNPDNDTYTTLNLNDVSSDYSTLTSLRNAPASVCH
ncbi:hypothetical protein AAFF_G00355990 [Aldrovandia affinis]|uniref:B-cell receptor CD22 n=1 Tax=Aldrovandia affinis TaxID=143900 RepID=A0AAD7VZV2_9TELE|nr:hypothetical protein AAFF_G00355990 [Aldrovandia affinis]